MNLEIIAATREHAHILGHLWPLYQYDLSEYGGMAINADGLFEEPSIRIHNYRTDLELWWNNTDLLHPFLIRIDGRAAGLVLVGRSPRFAPPDRDFEIVEFFLLRGFRGRGIGKSIALDMFRRFPGLWELRVLPENEPAIAFWREVIDSVAGDAFLEMLTYVDKDGGDMVIFRFEAPSIKE